MLFSNNKIFSVLLYLIFFSISACQDKTNSSSENTVLIMIPENKLPIITHDYEGLASKYLDKKGSCKTIKEDVDKIHADFNKASQLYLEAFCYHSEEEKSDREILTILREAYKLAPNDKNGVNLYALLSYNEDENEDSIRVFKHALSLSPENYELYSWMSITYGYMEEYDKAIAILDKGISFAKKDNNKEQLSDFYYEIGELYQDDDEYEKALNYYNLAIENRDEPNARLFNLTGMVYDDLDQTDKAIEMYKKSIATDSTFICAYNNMGFTLNTNDRKEEAKVILNKGLKADPGYDCGGMIYYNLGISYRDNDCKTALKDFNLAIKQDVFDNGKNIENGVNYNIGRCLVVLDSYDEGIKYLLKDQSLDEKSYYYLGLAYSKINNSEKAIEYLHKAIKDEETARSFELLGSVYLLERSLDKAKKYFKKALEEDDTRSLSFARLGLLEVKNNNLDNAIRFYKKATKNASTNIEFKRQLFLVYLKAEKCSAAKELIGHLSSLKTLAKLQEKLNRCR